MTYHSKRWSAFSCRMYAASFAWANFHKMVFYGHSSWPSYSYWIVPGTITDEERM